MGEQLHIVDNEVDNEKQPLIMRREYGYAGIYGITVTKAGEILFTNNPKPFPITEKVRLVENPPVENALSSPIKVFLDPSLACPLNCPFCLAGAPIVKKKWPANSQYI